MVHLFSLTVYSFSVRSSSNLVHIQLWSQRVQTRDTHKLCNLRQGMAGTKWLTGLWKTHVKGHCFTQPQTNVVLLGWRMLSKDTSEFLIDKKIKELISLARVHRSWLNDIAWICLIVLRSLCFPCELTYGNFDSDLSSKANSLARQ
jgi:hypothetical protein